MLAVLSLFYAVQEPARIENVNLPPTPFPRPASELRISMISLPCIIVNLARNAGPAALCGAVVALRSHHPDRPHLDGAIARSGAARRPGQRGVEVGYVDQVVAAELFLGLGGRPVEHLGPAVGDPHSGGRR